MSLSKALYRLLSTGSTQEDRPDMTEKLLTGTSRIETNKESYLLSVGVSIYYSMTASRWYCRMFLNAKKILFWE